jgi:hypothetical protein
VLAGFALFKGREAMRCRGLTAVLALAIAVTGGSACAMTTTSSVARCTVSGPDTLVSALGGADALCAIIQRATASSGAQAFVRVELLNPHAAVARTTVAGRALPERRIDISDRPLNRRAIESLAKAVADQLNALSGSASNE